MAKPKNPFQEVLNNLPAPLKNRYFLILGLFFFWMIFFDKHNVLVQWRLQKTLNSLENDMTFYSEQVKEAERMQKDLKVNQEKFAREKYYMKRNNEDVFIIIKDKNKKE